MQETKPLLRDIPAEKPIKPKTDILPSEKLALPQNKLATILAVDDDPDICAIIQKYFGCNGYNCVCAADGRKGLEAYKAAFEAGSAPDIIISDWDMPEMGGDEMFKEIIKINPKAKIIFLTRAPPEERDSLEALNPLAIFGKPFDPRTVEATIQNALTKE